MALAGEETALARRSAELVEAAVESGALTAAHSRELETLCAALLDCSSTALSRALCACSLAKAAPAQICGENAAFRGVLDALLAGSGSRSCAVVECCCRAWPPLVERAASDGFCISILGS